jgi:hypothetical protein
LHIVSIIIGKNNLKAGIEEFREHPLGEVTQGVRFYKE